MENFQCGSSYCLRLRAVPVPYTYLIEQEAQEEIEALLEGCFQTRASEGGGQRAQKKN